MAQDTKSYFSNATPEATLFKGNLYSVDSNPKYDIGHRVSTGDGRVFRYGQVGVATARGLLVSQDLSTTSLVDTDNIVVVPASAVAVPGEVVKPGAIGSKYVEITLAAKTVNQFEGAYLMITDDAGEGYTYRIKGNTATDNPVTGNLRLELYDKLQVALTAASDIAILGSMYSDLKAADATDPAVAGVTVANFAAAGWGWIQTWGPCAVLQDGAAIGVGSSVTLSDGVAGAVQTQDAYTEPLVGYGIIDGDDTGHGVIFLQVAP